MDSRRLQPVFHWSSNVSHFCAATSRTIQRGSVQRYRILHNLIENTPPKKSLILQENALKSSCFGIWSRRTIFWPPTDANLEDFNISEYDPSSLSLNGRLPPSSLSLHLFMEVWAGAQLEAAFWYASFVYAKRQGGADRHKKLKERWGGFNSMK